MPFDIEWVRAQAPGRNIIWLETTDSTMNAAAGQAPGTVVIAGAQTAGRGRHGRSWHSEPGAGLYFSVVLGPVAARHPATKLMRDLGKAVQQAIAEATGLNSELKWPNDVLIGGRKCAGILIQKRGASVVAGIGVNVNQTSFPGPLSDTAISLRMASGAEHRLEPLFVALLQKIEALMQLWDKCAQAAFQVS